MVWFFWDQQKSCAPMGAQLWDSEAADLRGVHPLQNGGGQPGGVLHVAVGGDAVVGMDVTHRDADDDDGHALVGQMGAPLVEPPVRTLSCTGMPSSSARSRA